MAEQDKYLGIFKDEALEHVEVLHDQLLDLENNPSDAEILRVILRSAHTIKGSARMVGLMGLGKLAHRMEDVLKALENGQRPVDTDVINLLLASADVIGAAVQGLPDVEPSDADLDEQAAAIDAFLAADEPSPAAPAAVEEAPPPEEAPAGDRQTLAAELSSLFGDAEPVAAETASPPVSEGAGPAPAPAEPAPEPAQPARALDREVSTRAPGRDPAQDTMRVKVPKLDNLSNLAGELVIIKSKMDNNIHRLARIFETIEETVSLGLAHDGPVRARKLQEIETLVQDTCLPFLEQVRADFGFLDLYAEEVLSETLNLRLLPVSTIFDRYHRLVRDLRHRLGKRIALSISGRDILLDKQILEEINPALMHIIQNAADHGIEPPEDRVAAGKAPEGRIELNAFYRGGNVVIEVRDDGRGIDVGTVRAQARERAIASKEEIESMSDRDAMGLVFRDGFSTAAIITGTSGRGVGMSVAWERVQALKGSASIDTTVGSHTSIQLVFPPTFYKMKALLVEAGSEIVCLPSSFLVTVAQLNIQDVAVEGPTPMVSVQNRIVPLVDLGGLLGLPRAEGDDGESEGDPRVKVVLVHVNEEYIALRVDRIHRMEEIIVKAAGAFFADAPLFAGVTILRQGDPSFILNVYQLYQLLKTQAGAGVDEIRRSRSPADKKSILVVDDSITTRTMEKSILEGAGYEVETAQDAEEALSIAADRVFDIVITDVEMPGLNGFELTKKLKATVMYRDVPVVIVTSLARSEDKKKGIEVGAQAYIVKGSFQQKTLLDTVRRLIGT